MEQDGKTEKAAARLRIICIIGVTAAMIFLIAAFVLRNSEHPPDSAQNRRLYQFCIKLFAQIGSVQVRKANQAYHSITSVPILLADAAFVTVSRCFGKQNGKRRILTAAAAAVCIVLSCLKAALLLWFCGDAPDVSQYSGLFSD